MPFPNPQILNAFLEHYKAKRNADWASFTTLKWIASISPWSTHEEPDIKKQICDKLKIDMTAGLADGKSELDKWTQICITLGEISTVTMKRNKDSLLAKYLHAMRTYILFKMNADEHIRNQLADLCEKLNKKVLSPKEPAESKTATETPIEPEQILLSLAYLGHEKAIVGARDSKLLSMYQPDASDKLIYFNENYFSADFFNERIKPGSTFASFNEYETGILTPAPAEEKQIEAPIAPATEPATASVTETMTITANKPAESSKVISQLLMQSQATAENKETAAIAQVPKENIIEEPTLTKPAIDASLFMVPRPIIIPAKRDPIIFHSAPATPRPGPDSEVTVEATTQKKVSFKKPIADVRTFTANRNENKEENTSTKGYNLRRRK